MGKSALSPDGGTSATVHLRLLGTTDLHVHIRPYDYYADAPLEGLGLACVADRIDEARAEAANCLLFDNGDFLQGNPMGDFIAYERGVAPDRLHPAIAAMNTLGYDAATLGNHEFNFGLEFLASAIAGANFPIISANAATRLAAAPEHDETILPPTAVLRREVTDDEGRRHRLTIGVIGLLPPQTAMWDRRHLQDRLWTRDMVETARNLVPLLRAEGCDLVVALAHTGLAGADWVAGMENAGLPLAAVPGIDALFLGHTHLTFPGPDHPPTPHADMQLGTLHGKPAAMAGLWGSHLAVLDLWLRQGRDGWSVATHRAELRPASTLPLSAAARRVLAANDADHGETLADIRRPVGATSGPFTSYFALLCDDPSLQIVIEAQRDEIARRLAGTPYADLPLLSAAAPLKSGGRAGHDFYTDVPAGEMAIRHVADLYQYPNTIRAVCITGAELAEWLERAAGVFARIVPDRPDQLLLCPDFARYNFDVIGGVTYAIDPTVPSRYGPRGEPADPTARRIRDLRWNGVPVDPAARFVVATNNYRADGGGSFPGATPGNVVYSAPDTTRDVLLRHIASAGTVHPRRVPNWSLCAPAGFSAIYETSPRGIGHLPEVPGLRLDPLGLSDEGALRIRVSFLAR